MVPLEELLDELERELDMLIMDDEIELDRLLLIIEDELELDRLLLNTDDELELDRLLLIIDDELRGTLELTDKEELDRRTELLEAITLEDELDAGETTETQLRIYAAVSSAHWSMQLAGLPSGIQSFM